MGAALAEALLPVFPMAPDPFVPEVSTPANVMIVMEADGEEAENVAVAVTLERTEAANARQISAVPPCVFVRTTIFQVRPPPATPVTVMFCCSASLEINASTSSLLATVEKAPLVIVVEDVP